LIIPVREDLGFIDSLWRDVETMAPVGGPICKTTSQMEDWFTRMIYPGSRTDRYFIIATDNGIKIGEASFHRFGCETKTAHLNIKVKVDHRGKGFAGKALTQLLAFYFGPFGGLVIQDAVGLDNLGGQQFLKSYGFRLIERTESAILFELGLDEFRKLIL
jgi:RimJ/RimL family protein N-acetyltransferase